MKKNRRLRKKEDATWHRLDNAANVFPIVSGPSTSNVFRVSAELCEPIEPKLLQQALEATLPWFKHFQFRLRKGFFWNYFEPNRTPIIQVEEELERPCSYIDRAANGHYLFKVFYYKNRISLEVFHVVTDGTGAIQFLKAIVLSYLQLLEDLTITMDREKAEVFSHAEDSYKKNYKKQKTKEHRLKKGYHLKGTKLPVYEIGIIHGYTNLENILKLCKAQNVSLTVYLTAVYIWSIYRSEQLENTLHKPIRIAVPVNLRRFFDSNTTLNFFSHITTSMESSNEPITFDMILACVKKAFKDGISKEKFSATIAKNIATRRNPFIRFLPLFIKSLFVKGIYMSSMGVYTSTLSNVGQIEVPEHFISQIAHFQFMLNPTLSNPVKMAICSYNNELVITLTSQLVRTDLQKEFFRKLASDGLEVLIESNGVYYENM